MSDEEEFEEYDPVKLMADLEAKDALRPCPCCGVTNWGTPEDGLFLVLGTVSERGIEHRVPTTMECAPVICNNCNFVRFHVQGLIMGNMLPK